MTVGQLIRYSLSKLVVECFGTFMMTLFFYEGGQAVMLLGLWILIVFGWKISGSQYNPAITFAYMFRKDNKKFPKPLGIAYILFQILGAFIGGLIILFFVNGNVTPLGLEPYCYACLQTANNNCGKSEIPANCNNPANLGITAYYHHYWFEAMVQEVLGTFITVLFFMMMTDETMLFSREKAINCFIIACGYISARAMFAGTRGAERQVSNLGACLNPAIALGIFFASMCTGAYNWDALTDLLIYPLMPLLGSLLALLFFEFAYKKTQEVLEHGPDDSGSSQANQIFEENPLAE